MLKVRYVGYEVVGENYARIFRPNGSGDYVLVYFHETMHVLLENEIAVAEPDTMILYKPGVEQDFSALRDFSATYVHFTADPEEVARLGVPEMKVLCPENADIVRQFLEQLNREYYTRDIGFEDQMDSLLRNLFVYLSRELHENSPELADRASLYRLFCEARFTMLSNCEKEWASTNMPEMVSKSRSQFYKYYNEFFGISPMADLNRARIVKAKILLTNKDVSVTEVASLVGYASIHHFSRTFKEHTGLSPLQYVKRITNRR